MVFGPRIRQLHSPGELSNHKASFLGSMRNGPLPILSLLRTSAKTFGVRFLIIKKVTENARCPFLDY